MRHNKLVDAPQNKLGLPKDTMEPITNYAGLEAALIEIRGWCEEILNSDRGACGYELREFAGDVYGRVCDALGGQP